MRHTGVPGWTTLVATAAGCLLAAAVSTAQPDLRIVVFWVAPDPVAVGEEVEATIWVRNGGTRPSSPCQLAVWRHRAAPPVFPATGDANWLVPGILDGMGRSYSWSFTPNYPGPRTAWATIDALDEVVERDETNNTAADAYEIMGLPELAVEELTVAPSPSVLGTELVLSATVRSRGALSAPPSRLAVWRHRAAPPVVPSDGETSWDLPALPGGASAQRSLMFTPQYLGPRTAWALVDAGDDVEEANESNNARAAAYETVGPPAPDLAVLLMSVVPDAILLGAEVTYNLVVRNDGNAASAAFAADLWFHRSAFPVVGSPGANVRWEVDGLPPGGTAARTAAYTPVYPGQRSAYVLLDARAEIDESDEMNNTVRRDYTINAAAGDADLVTISVAVTPSPSDLGVELTYDVTVRNQGIEATGGFSVDLWYHRTTPPIVGSAGFDERWSSAGLAPLEEASFSATLTPSYSGDRTARALADSLNDVPESSEINNAAAGPYHIEPPAEPAGAGRPRRPTLE